jgi:hypothetical protein
MALTAGFRDLRICAEVNIVALNQAQSLFQDRSQKPRGNSIHRKAFRTDRTKKAARQQTDRFSFQSFKTGARGRAPAFPAL